VKQGELALHKRATMPRGGGDLIVGRFWAKSDKILVRRRMSAFGTKRTWHSRSAMSAFGGKADIAMTSENVPLWPKSTAATVRLCCAARDRRSARHYGMCLDVGNAGRRSFAERSENPV